MKRSVTAGNSFINIYFPNAQESVGNTPISPPAVPAPIDAILRRRPFSDHERVAHAVHNLNKANTRIGIKQSITPELIGPGNPKVGGGPRDITRAVRGTS